MQVCEDLLLSKLAPHLTVFPPLWNSWSLSGQSFHFSQQQAAAKSSNCVDEQPAAACLSAFLPTCGTSCTLHWGADSGAVSPPLDGKRTAAADSNMEMSLLGAEQQIGVILCGTCDAYSQTCWLIKLGMMFESRHNWTQSNLMPISKI